MTKQNKLKSKVKAAREAAIRRTLSADVRRRVGTLKRTRKPKRPRKMVIDADILLYQATTQFLMEEGPDENDEYRYTLSGTDVKEYVKDRLDEIKKTFFLSEILLCFSSRSNWRKIVFRDYKANRTGNKPLGYLDIKKRLAKIYPCEEVPHLEADDLMGIHATDPNYFDGDVIIYSEDKDMATIPGLWVDPRNLDRGIIETDAKAAFLSHMAQTMTGDMADNYPGIRGIGPKKAENILAPVVNKKLLTIWKTVVNAFVKGGLTPEITLTTARVAYILRHGDYDFKTGEISSWEPPS